MFVYKMIDNVSGFSSSEADVYPGSLNGGIQEQFVITNRDKNDKFGAQYFVYKVSSTVLASVRYDVGIPVNGILNAGFCKIWIKDNKIHRDDGPAHIYHDKDKYYFIDGIALSFENFVKRQENTEHYDKLFAATFGENNE